MGNSYPIYSKVGDIQWGATLVKDGNIAVDGTATGATLVFSADATSGGYVQKIRFRAAGSNVASVGRVFINNSGVTSTAANNILYDEITLAATTISQVSALPTYELPLNIALPPSYRLYVTLGTAVATGYFVSVVGGKY